MCLLFLYALYNKLCEIKSLSLCKEKHLACVKQCISYHQCNHDGSIIVGDVMDVLQAIPLVKRLDTLWPTPYGGCMSLPIEEEILEAKQESQNFEAQIILLVRRAYPMIPDEVHEMLASERFLDLLHLGEIQQAVMLAFHRTLKDALSQALEFEVVNQSVKKSIMCSC